MESKEYDILWPNKGNTPLEGGNKLNYNVFIKRLLNNPSATKADKERIVDLLLKEKEKGYMTEGQVRRIIEQYKFATREQVQRMIEQRGETRGANQKLSAIRYHNPERMVDFLCQFSKNENYKWFTHAPDPGQEFDYEAYTKRAKSGFQEISKGINQSTWNNVYNFIFDTEYPAKDSLNDNIKVRWKDLIQWCNEHKLKHPYYELVDDYSFEHYITIFKNTIEFRTDDNSSSFCNRIEDYVCDYAIKSPDFIPKFKDSFYSIGGSLRAYVDVRQLFFVISEIGKWIISNKKKSNTVELSIFETDDKYVFSIFHLGSCLNIDDAKMKGLSGDFHKIRNMLLNVADLTIEADSKEAPKRIVCLDSKTEYILNEDNKAIVSSANEIQTIKEKVDGVKYLITIFKNTHS